MGIGESDDPFEAIAPRNAGLRNSRTGIGCRCQFHHDRCDWLGVCGRLSRCHRLALGVIRANRSDRSEEEKRGLVRWLRPDYQIPRFAKDVDKQAAKEEGAQVAAELVAAVEQKPSFPPGAVEQTAAVFAALAAASEPLDAKGLAAQFKRTKTTEKKIGEVLASLARLGYVTSEDGNAFALRRVA